MIDHLDHLVLTTARREACIDFYTRVLGMQLETFIGGTPPVSRQAFEFGTLYMQVDLLLAEPERAPAAGKADRSHG